MSRFTDWVKREVANKISIIPSNFLGGNLLENKLLITTGEGSKITLLDNTILNWKFKTSNFVCVLGEAYSVHVGNTLISAELPETPSDGYVILFKSIIDTAFNQTLEIYTNTATGQTINGIDDTLIVDYSTDVIMVYDSINNTWRV